RTAVVWPFCRYAIAAFGSKSLERLALRTDRPFIFLLLGHAATHFEVNFLAVALQDDISGRNFRNLESGDRILRLQNLSVIGSCAIKKGERPLFVAHGANQSKGRH